MNTHDIEKALEQYEEELNEMPDDELIGEERLQAEREDEIAGRLDAYADDLENMPDDELLDLETIREEIIEKLLEQRAEALKNQES